MLATHVDVESVEEHVDFTTLKEREPQEQEARLIELVETGQTIVAIKLARSLYGLNLTDAKTFVDGLSGEATTKD
jgi:ribosomal protein L7/L12